MVRVILHKETKHNALDVDLLGFKPPICRIARIFHEFNFCGRMYSRPFCAVQLSLFRGSIICENCENWIPRNFSAIWYITFLHLGPISSILNFLQSTEMITSNLDPYIYNFCINFNSHIQPWTNVQSHCCEGVKIKPHNYKENQTLQNFPLYDIYSILLMLPRLHYLIRKMVWNKMNIFLVL